MSEAPSSSERIHSKPLSSPHRQRRQPPNAIPDKDLRFKIVVRVYGAHGDCTYGHSYIVDDVPLGISSPVAEYYLGMTHLQLSYLLPSLSDLLLSLHSWFYSTQMPQNILSKNCVICYVTIQLMLVIWRRDLWFFRKVMSPIVEIHISSSLVRCAPRMDELPFSLLFFQSIHWVD